MAGLGSGRFEAGGRRGGEQRYTQAGLTTGSVERGNFGDGSIQDLGGWWADAMTSAVQPEVGV